MVNLPLTNTFHFLLKYSSGLFTHLNCGLPLTFGSFISLPCYALRVCIGTSLPLSRLTRASKVLLSESSFSELFIMISRRTSRVSWRNTISSSAGTLLRPCRHSSRPPPSPPQQHPLQPNSSRRSNSSVVRKKKSEMEKQIRDRETCAVNQIQYENKSIFPSLSLSHLYTILGELSGAEDGGDGEGVLGRWGEARVP